MELADVFHAFGRDDDSLTMETVHIETTAVIGAIAFHECSLSVHGVGFPFPGVGGGRCDKRAFAFHAAVDEIAGVFSILADGFFAVSVDAVAFQALGARMGCIQRERDNEREDEVEVRVHEKSPEVTV